MNNGFSFTQVSGLKVIPQNATVDVIGVVFEMGGVSSIKLKTGESRDRVNIVVADESDCSVPITVWGDHAHRMAN